MLIGAAGVLARWRRWGGPGLLSCLVGALLIVLPPVTAGFSYRYVLAAAPLVCLAAGLAFCPAPDGKSLPALAAHLRRKLGRGGAADQAVALGDSRCTGDPHPRSEANEPRGSPRKSVVNPGVHLVAPGPPQTST